MEVRVKNKNEKTQQILACKKDYLYYLKADINNFNNEKLYGDLCAYDEISKCIRIFSGGRASIPTGLKIEVPTAYEINIQPLASWMLYSGIITSACPYINNDGELHVIVINTGTEPIEIDNTTLLATFTLQKVAKIEFNYNDKKSIKKKKEND